MSRWEHIFGYVQNIDENNELVLVWGANIRELFVTSKGMTKSTRKSRKLLYIYILVLGKKRTGKKRIGNKRTEKKTHRKKAHVEKKRIRKKAH